MAAAGELEAAELYFGCRTAAEDITARLRPAAAAHDRLRQPRRRGRGVFHGRVTQALAGLAFDPAATDFYVCGSAAMVADCRAILGARRRDPDLDRTLIEAIDAAIR